MGKARPSIKDLMRGARGETRDGGAATGVLGDLMFGGNENDWRFNNKDMGNGGRFNAEERAREARREERLEIYYCGAG